MGISSTANRITYAGDGSSATFIFPYYFTKTTDLNVYLYDTVAGGIVTQSLNGGGGTGFTISGTQNTQGIFTSGGNVVFNSSPVATSIVVIDRSPSQVQNFALATNGLISATALVNQLDYLTILVQRLEEQITRSVGLPDGMGSSAFSPALPSTIGLNPNVPLIVNSSATGFVAGGVIQLSGSSANTFVGTLPIVNGGTGVSTVPASGQLPYAASATAYGYVTGSSGAPLLGGGGGAPTFGSVTVAYGGTGLTAGGTPGQILYASSAAQLAFLSGSSGAPLISQGANLAPTFSGLGVAYGGTGLTAGGATGQIVYASSATQLGFLSGSSGAPLVSNGANAPSFGPINLANYATGVLPAANGGTGSSGFASGFLLTGNPIQNSPIAVVGSSVQVGDGGSSAPAMAFTLEASTGFYRVSSGQIALSVLGQYAMNVQNTAGQINFGFGGPPSGASNNPAVYSCISNQPMFYTYQNRSTGTAGACVFQIQSGTASNYLTFENYGTLNAGYLKGAAIVSANGSMTGLNIASEFSAGYLAFNVGGRTLATEVVRINGSSVVFNGGAKVVFTGSSVSGGSVSLSSANSSAAYSLLWPGAQSGASQVLQNDGSGNLSWVTAATGALNVATKTASYNAVTTDGVILTNSSSFNVNLYGASGNSGRQITVIKTDTNLTNTPTTIVGSSANIQGSSFVLSQKWDSATLLTDGTNWDVIASRKAPTVTNINSGTSTYTTPGGVLYLRVKLVGGGGGGAGSGSAAAGAGGTGGLTYFGSSVIVVNCTGGGAGPAAASGVAAGGVATVSSGTGVVQAIVNVTGGGGQGGFSDSITTVFGQGGQGGASYFGGNGSGGAGNQAGTAGAANTGGGGGGAGNANVSGQSGGGGGAGGYAEVIVYSPAATYLYSVGAAGTVGGAGTSGFAGGLGGTGYIVVEEHYQ